MTSLTTAFEAATCHYHEQLLWTVMNWFLLVEHDRRVRQSQDRRIQRQQRVHRQHRAQTAMRHKRAATLRPGF